MPSIQNRIAGGFWGLLIGDALGVPYEFHRRDEIPPLDGIEMEVPHGFERAYSSIPAGTWSDDGAQALCLLDSLLTHGRLDIQDFAQRLVSWRTDGLWAVDGRVFGVGSQTEEAIRVLRQGIPAHRSGFVRPDGKGNGSLMRVLPLALWHRGSDKELVRDAHAQSAVTHGHVTNQVCCALYCLWARRLLDGRPVSDAFQSAVESLRRIYGAVSAYRTELDDTVRPDVEPTTDGSGYVVATLNAARIATAAGDFVDAVRAAVAFGGDTDTYAAVTGGLAGIAFGVEGIPARWLDRLRGRERVAPLLDRLLDMWSDER